MLSYANKPYYHPFCGRVVWLFAASAHCSGFYPKAWRKKTGLWQRPGQEPLNTSTPPPPHITSSNTDTTQIGTPQHRASATTPAALPTPHQHRHQQWRNALTHATTIEGSPGQQRTAQKRRPGHCGPWVMSQQTLYRGGGEAADSSVSPTAGTRTKGN